MSAPVKKFTAGGVTAAVWENGSGTEAGGTYNTVSMDRRYKDKNDAWKSTTSLKANDIPKAILALQKAYEYVALKAPSTETEIADM